MPPSADPALELSSARHGDAAVLSPRGRIDHASAEAFKAALAPHLERCGPGRPVILDLAGVDYIASVGLRVLMLASRQARAQGGTILVAALQPLVREIFDALARLRAGGLTILLVEQMAAQALALADRAYVLASGRITVAGTAAEVRANPAVIQAYLGRSGGSQGSGAAP